MTYFHFRYINKKDILSKAGLFCLGVVHSLYFIPIATFYTYFDLILLQRFTPTLV